MAHGVGFLFVGVLLGLLGVYFGSDDLNDWKPSMVRFDLGPLRTTKGKLLFLRRLAVGMVDGVVTVLTLASVFGLVSRLASMLKPELGFGVMSWLHSVLLPLLAFGLALGLVRVLLVTLQGGIEIAPSPSVLARQGIQYPVASGLALGLVFGVGTGLWSGQQLGLAPGLALGLATGLALGLGFGLMYGGWGWLRYAVGVHAAVRKDLLPTRPARFLDWCLRTGLMRMAGSSVQFRHRQLQDWLTSPAERAVQAEWQARRRESVARH